MITFPWTGTYIGTDMQVSTYDKIGQDRQDRQESWDKNIKINK